jgi:hypothetical protein
MLTREVIVISGPALGAPVPIFVLVFQFMLMLLH